jgi:hypothetical protein
MPHATAAHTTAARTSVSCLAEAVDRQELVTALTVLPTLYVLGAFTFVWVVDCGAEDFRYGLAINRIRGYHRQVARDQANLTGGIEPMFPSRQQEGQGGRRDFCSLRLREGLQEADARPTE